MNLANIFNRVGTWNSKRYEREYNHALSVSLLEEELKEYFDASTRVDQLDALCDLVYVALGVLWKLDVSNEVLDTTAEESHVIAAKLLDAHPFDPIYLVTFILAVYSHNNDYPIALSMQSIITLCMTQMSAMGLNSEESYMSLVIVCDSNDSKSIKKVASDIKANEGDKGVYFIPPETKLRQLLDIVEKRHGS